MHRITFTEEQYNSFIKIMNYIYISEKFDVLSELQNLKNEISFKDDRELFEYLESNNEEFLFQDAYKLASLDIGDAKLNNFIVNLPEDIDPEPRQWSKARKKMFNTSVKYFEAIKTDTITDELRKAMNEAMLPYNSDLYTVLFEAETKFYANVIKKASDLIKKYIDIAPIIDATITHVYDKEYKLNIIRISADHEIFGNQCMENWRANFMEEYKNEGFPINLLIGTEDDFNLFNLGNKVYEIH